ncbi:acyltransferase family protein [Streptomyces montanisoli]|uniref:Acyltransferase n=1 Tax=Streptomyces montanisoli TaxID=2798581 RepID=A0A940MBQ0_9ACTN|nr:acyltransferase [Streptomyces montanisoli]MBP0456717.1 acyltransferase [Streptomyces montanisoli]
MAQHSAAPRRSQPSPAPRATPRAGRPHLAPLDGLRGLAVAAVLLFHAGYLRGGFLGVDLFFVLSGFLITGLLLSETGRAGRIDLAAFWARRARRLLPALVVMGVATLLLAWAFGSPSLLAFALDDAPWAAAQAVNWHFIAEQVGYWNASDTRLFSHLWSIAVEWQFYLAWPLVVLAAGRGRRGEHRVAGLAVVGAVASLALMIMFDNAVDTTRVYEGTDTRAFSLLLGAAAATRPVRARLARVPRQAGHVLCAVLACGLVASWALTDGQHAPGLFEGGMFLHSLAAAVLIAALAAAPDGHAGRVLGSVVPRGLGELSYGLYLWHWPVYLLLPPDVLGFGGLPRTAVLIAVSLAAAALSKRLVEDPVRFRARWATGRRGLAVLAATAVVAAGVWVAIPQPRLGAGTVDVHRLMEP